VIPRSLAVGSWLLLVAWPLGALPVMAADWTHWRGPTRDGRTTERSGWDGGGWPPREAWRVRVGEGASAPLVVGRRVYVLGWRDGEDRLACLDAANGRQLWAAASRAPKYGRHATGDEAFYFGPSSTPEFDAATGFIYTLSTDGHLQCLDTRRDGAQVWEMNLYDRYGVGRRPRVGRSGQRDYGYTSSPLLLGEQLIVEVGAATGTLVAFDTRTGAERWRSEATDPAGHNGGPVPIVVEGVACVAVHHLDGLLVARADPAAADVGRTVATWPWRTDFGNNIATPAVHCSTVVMTSAYNHVKIARLDITLAGATLAWERPDLLQRPHRHARLPGDPLKDRSAPQEAAPVRIEPNRVASITRCRQRQPATEAQSRPRSPAPPRPLSSHSPAKPRRRRRSLRRLPPRGIPCRGWHVRRNRRSSGPRSQPPVGRRQGQERSAL